MLSHENITDLLRAARGEGGSVTMRDLAFLLLSDICEDEEDREAFFRIVYATAPMADSGAWLSSTGMVALARAAQPFGVGVEKDKSISREENQKEMERLLPRIEQAMAEKKMEVANGLKMMADIRVKLQDKFDIEETDDSQRHIIVVPQKHDLICPHTNRECTQMPSKEACCKYYNLKDK